MIIPLDRNPNFVCAACNGNLIVVREDHEGRKTFNCDSCGKNQMQECTKCHNPRTIWADDGRICGSCVLRVMSSVEGEFTLTVEEAQRVDKWRVPIQP